MRICPYCGAPEDSASLVRVEGVLWEKRTYCCDTVILLVEENTYTDKGDICYQIKTRKDYEGQYEDPKENI